MEIKPTIWIFALEQIQTRYTAEWYDHVPKLLEKNLGTDFNIIQIDGIQKNTKTTPGAFLNFSDTNYWKSSQLCNWLDHYNNGEVGPNDQFLFTDAWNPTVIQLRYMNDLLGYNWKLHGLWHAGNYDPYDALGRILGSAAWVKQTEKSFFHAFDHNYFATQFHFDMFCINLLSTSRGFYKEWIDNGKIVPTGWPMEYMSDTLTPYKNMKKKDIILFPHRVAPEKQVEIFRDLASVLPQYQFIVCQDKTLSKHEYHSLLGESKILFSASNQETLGISPYEGAILDVIPLVPDRLSYTEMYYEGFKYPNQWTRDWDSYMQYRQTLCHHIIVTMTHYEKRLPMLKKQTQNLTDIFFSANGLLNTLRNKGK